MLRASLTTTMTLLVLTLAIGASSIMVDSVTKAPLVFSKWPPYQNSKSPSLRNQIFQHLRSVGRIPPNMLVKRYPSALPYMMRPMKYPQLKKVPIAQSSYYRPTISTPPRYRFQSSPGAPNSGEYIFENPFNTNANNNNNLGYQQSNKKKVSLTDDTKYTPIHTVPAPNLNQNLAYSTQAEYIHEPVDNHIFEQKDPQFNQITFRPLTVPQYQVTEQISDHTIRVDPFTGKPKMYGPDSAHSIPTYKIAPTFDSFSQSNGVASRPMPIEISFIPQQQPHAQPQQPQAQAQVQASSAPVAAPLIQLANQIPQQQLPDTYALPIGNQPQLQQHLLQQQSMLQSMPVSVYNPTYLVTQSNNLLKQHREQLFKPAPSYLDSLSRAPVNLTPDNIQPLQDVNSVASVGQLIESQQNQHKEAQHSQSQQAHSNAIPLRPHFTASLSPQTDNTPSYQRYVAERPSSSGIVVHQPVLTESELNSLLNIGHQEANDHSQFVASTFYQQQPDPQIEIENRQRQQFNDLKIAKANEELQEQYNSAEVTSNSQKKTAHQQHQEKLAEQFSGKTTLRIYVPDEDYQKKNEVRRSDLYRTEIKSEFIPSRRDDYRGNASQYIQEYESDTTTDANDDYQSNDTESYLSHDTESVDRLALDGETREPISSSTIDTYNY